MRIRALASAALAALVARQAAACCQLGGSACGDPFAVDCNNGVVCFIPWKTCPGCICTTTSTGKTCLESASEPGAVATLLIGKSATPPALDFSWGSTCTAAASADYTVNEGAIGVWYSHAPLTCSTGGALTAAVTPSAGDRYYLVAPIAAGFTGSFGTSSTGAERPDGEPSCTDARALAPCP